jgi:sterol desaturase/sphingolipid hydroxylase (fatty acid hydroxylase superfamily)
MLNDYISSNILFESNLTWPTVSFGEFAAYSLFIFFALMFTLEVNFPRKKWPSKKWRQSLRTNFSLLLFINTLLSLVSVSTLLIFAEQYSDNGLLSQFSNPVGRLILSFLLLDLIIYWWHRACHKFGGLWMFHKVHHSDPHMNISTAFRLHFLELVIVTVLKAVSIVALGVGKASVLATETLTLLFAMFHHANVSFAGENFWGRLVIVPILHRTHHSTERCEHDRNFGAVLSVWDRVFGSLLEKEPEKMGVKNNGGLGFLDQLKFGFTNGVPAQETHYAPDPNTMHAMIAEAAYYKSLNRGFSPGLDLEDWLQGEWEIAEQLQMVRSKLKRNQSRNIKRFIPLLSA